MKTLQNSLLFAKKLVQILGNKTMHRSDWTVLCVSETKFGVHQFDRMLKFLVAEGYVERVKVGVYRVTQRGRAFANI
jgi:predicted transcriptional regulator